MKLVAKYEHLEVDVTSQAKRLKIYAASIMQQMQKLDSGYAGCWEACVISIEGLDPSFQFGSIGDMEAWKNEILVTCPSRNKE